MCPQSIPAPETNRQPRTRALTPSHRIVVAVAIPTWGPYLFGAVCIVIAVAQIVGFLGVYREKPKLFKTYARANGFLVSIALAIAIAFIGLSAGRHSTAVTKCQSTFSSQTTGSTVKSGSEICNIWTWVQVGIMGLLFIILALCEGYFIMYQNIYASEQRLDHARYDQVVTTAAEEIRQSGLWDSGDGFAPPGGYAHQRTESKSSGLRNELHAEPSSEYLSEQAYRDHDGGYPVASGSQGAGAYQEPYYGEHGVVEGYQEGYGYEEEKYGGQYVEQAHQGQHPLDLRAEGQQQQRY
ncbi:hypothetical protein P7C70_g2242, partial [Phenoliferia sp. Uapishka_3]